MTHKPPIKLRQAAELARKINDHWFDHTVQQVAELAHLLEDLVQNWPQHTTKCSQKRCDGCGDPYNPDEMTTLPEGDFCPECVDEF